MSRGSFSSFFLRCQTSPRHAVGGVVVQGQSSRRVIQHLESQHQDRQQRRQHQDRQRTLLPFSLPYPLHSIPRFKTKQKRNMSTNTKQLTSDPFFNLPVGAF